MKILDKWANWRIATMSKQRTSRLQKIIIEELEKQPYKIGHYLSFNPQVARRYSPRSLIQVKRDRKIHVKSELLSASFSNSMSGALYSLERKGRLQLCYGGTIERHWTTGEIMNIKKLLFAKGNDSKITIIIHPDSPYFQKDKWRIALLY
jgi:hypothetical protein